VSGVSSGLRPTVPAVSERSKTQSIHAPTPIWSPLDPCTTHDYRRIPGEHSQHGTR
ncbi:hypothetical protein EJ07DRAFT_31673, partial [Lizonia empirigonia]